MASLPPLLSTPPASLKVRHRSLEPPPQRPEDSGSCLHRGPSPPPSSRGRARGTQPPSKVRRRSRSPSNVRRRSRSPPPSKLRRRSRSPPPSKFRRRSRSPPYVSTTQRLAERHHAKRPLVEAAVKGERSRPSSLDDSLSENRPSHSNRNCEHPETSSSAREKRPDPAIWGDEHKLDCEKMDRKNHSDDKAPSRSARRKKLKRQIKAEAKKEMREHPETSSPATEKRPDPAITEDEQTFDCEKMDRKNQSDYKAPSRSARRKKLKRQIKAEAKKEMREMKKDKLLENIKKLQSCIWLLEKDGADMAEIMEFRSMLESTKKQYAETEARLAKEGSSAPLQAPSRNGSAKTTKGQIWEEAKKEFREMKKDKLLENIKKLQCCVWLLEKDGADMAEIMEFRSMLESTQKQYVENEAQLAMEGSSAPLQVLIRDRLEKTVVPERNELVEEVNHLKSELETVTRDHDDQLAQAQSLMADVEKQKEVARRCGIELEDAMMRIAALEKGCLLRKETINALQIQLGSANEKLTVPSPARDLMPN